MTGVQTCALPIYSFKRGAPLMRYLAMGVFDKISFAAFLLELYRKNIIDIQRGDKDILLVKRTDNLSSLERKERKAVNALFSRSEAVLALNAANQLKLKRAYKQVEANTLRKVKQLALKLNIGYLLFSIGMLLVAEAADRKSTRLNSSHTLASRMPSSA